MHIVACMSQYKQGTKSHVKPVCYSVEEALKLIKQIEELQNYRFFLLIKFGK